MKKMIRFSFIAIAAIFSLSSCKKDDAKTKTEYYVIPNRPEVAQQVHIEASIDANNFGGVGFQHTGTVGSGATLIKDLKIEWQ